MTMYRGHSEVDSDWNFSHDEWKQITSQSYRDVRSQLDTSKWYMQEISGGYLPTCYVMTAVEFAGESVKR